MSKNKHKAKAQRAIDRAADQARINVDKMNANVDGMKANAANTAHTVSGKLEDATDSIGDKLKHAAEAVSEKIKDGGVTVKDIGSHIKHKLER